MADNQQETSSASPSFRVAQEMSTLKLKFGTLSGEKTFSFNYADPTADRADIKSLIQTMITNGAIFKYPPLVASEAWVETKTVTEYPVS